MLLRKSLPAFLVSLLVLALAYPILACLAIAGTPLRPVMLYLLGTPGYFAIYRVMSIPFLTFGLRLDSPISLLLFCWVVVAAVMAVPAAIVGRIALNRLNRHGKTELWRCALAGAIWIPLPWLVILMIRVMTLGDFVDFLTALVAGVPMLYFWLALFGGAQGLVYAILVQEPPSGSPPAASQMSALQTPPHRTRPQPGFGRRMSG